MINLNEEKHLGITMTLLQEPVLTKFFTNKIESSQFDWTSYLLNIAEIFAMFDNDIYDRDSLTERFKTISGRSPYADRDVSNFRDEFGAYGTYLGMFHFKKEQNNWKIILSEAAKHFLCVPEPDVSSFCILQLALFQYPNGAGCAINPNGTARIQSNVKEDTKNEILNNVRIIPFRLICRSFVALHEIADKLLTDIELDYKTIFKLFNDSLINRTYNPKLDDIITAINSYLVQEEPLWVNQKLAKFKRNFHIFEQTNLFIRTNNGLKINPINIDFVYDRIKTIANMKEFYGEFEKLYDNFEQEEFEKIIMSQSWGEYYDGVRLPLKLIQKIVNHTFYIEKAPFEEITETSTVTNETTFIFPKLIEYEYNERANYKGENKFIDTQAAVVAREKANIEHERIIQMINSYLQLLNVTSSNNIFIDLFTNISGVPFLFEVKTTTPTNYISQIRKGLSQLYEYRYRLNEPNAILCLILQNKPKNSWVIDYLINDRNINVCWLADEVSFECPETCYENLKLLNFVKIEK